MAGAATDEAVVPRGLNSIGGSVGTEAQPRRAAMREGPCLDAICIGAMEGAATEAAVFAALGAIGAKDPAITLGDIGVKAPGDAALGTMGVTEPCAGTFLATGKREPCDAVTGKSVCVCDFSNRGGASSRTCFTGEAAFAANEAACRSTNDDAVGICVEPMAK